MTEEIIKECKNCDALGIDSEIGVYYCCLSHRQDDLPKEFTCNDFTPNKQLKRLQQELKWANDEEKYLKDCCIKAGKELEKHSFKWDGKEKNLVVQALQLNQQYDELKQENKELRNKNICRETCEYFKKICNENTLLIKYRAALEEIKKYIVDELCGYYHSKKDDYNEILEKIESIIDEVLND